ncbi:hypothetical protein [Hydrogenophaga sp.]|uniref:hypothetical protein n=1 Tax=Hydrogenophaga sp. TaxID=1904254 RepID=UPI0035AF0464
MEIFPDDQQQDRSEGSGKGKEPETWTDLEFGQGSSDSGSHEASTPDDPTSPGTDRTIRICSSEGKGPGLGGDPTGSAIGDSQDEPDDHPPQPLKELVRIYLDQANEAQLQWANRIAATDLKAVCATPPYDVDRHADDLAALGRARRYLHHLALNDEDIDTILANAKAKAQVTPVPGVSSPGLLNSLGASTAMYLVTFFLGKWLTAATGIGLVFTGPAGSAALAALVNALVVPLTQAITGDPMGAALRNFGPNVPSEDSRQYAAFMTAHALYMRANVAGAHAALAPKFALEMDRALNAVVWREQGRPGTVTGKPLFIASGVDPIIDPARPKAEVEAALKGSPYTKAQRYKVVAAMLARILVSDELPVHTFTFLNGVTGCLNTMWPALFGLSSTGQVITRVVDAAVHTCAGLFAMYFMFLLQDWIRPMVQGVGPTDPTNDAYLDDKSTPKLIELTLDESRLAGAYLVLDALRRLRTRLKNALKAQDLPDTKTRVALKDLLKQCRDLCKEYKALSKEVGTRKARTQDDIRALTSATGAISRAVLDVGRVVTGRTGHTVGATWTDGSPSVVRGVSKYLGYASALMPVTAMSIATSRAIGASLEAAKVLAANAANAANVAGVAATAGGAAQARYAEARRYWVQPVTPADVTLTPSQIGHALQPHAAASGTTALVAILGWNTRNVLFDPLYQHVIHAGIGLVERLAGSCSTMTTPPVPSSTTVTMPSVIASGDHPPEDEPSGASSETDTRVESLDDPEGASEEEMRVRSEERSESGSESGSETASDSASADELASAGDFVQSLQQTALELTALTRSAQGDADTTADLEVALTAITAPVSETSDSDSPTRVNGQG